MSWVLAGVLAAIGLVFLVRLSRPSPGARQQEFLPFRTRCPECGADPSPVGVATSAVLLGLTPVAFINEHGPLCADHCAAMLPKIAAARPTLTEAEFTAANEEALRLVAVAAQRRADDLVVFRVGNDAGITETHYASGRVDRHQPPIPPPQ